MDTENESCDDLESCKAFVRRRQEMQMKVEDKNKTANDILDIKENFLIAPCGIIFEGRGFSYEGQHTQDESLTSYNSKAIGIAFIGNYTKKNLTRNQVEAFESLVWKNVRNGFIKADFKLYHRDQITCMKDFENDNLFKTVRTWDRWSESELIRSQMFYLEK